MIQRTQMIQTTQFISHTQMILHIQMILHTQMIPGANKGSDLVGGGHVHKVRSSQVSASVGVCPEQLEVSICLPQPLDHLTTQEDLVTTTCHKHLEKEYRQRTQTTSCKLGRG